MLERDGVRTLLSCKYGSAAVVGAPALLGLAKSATLRGTGEVIVVTPGRFDEEAARIARQQNIELILIGIVAVSVIPMAIEYWRHRRLAAKPEASAQA